MNFPSRWYLWDEKENCNINIPYYTILYYAIDSFSSPHHFSIVWWARLPLVGSPLSFIPLYFLCLWGLVYNTVTICPCSIFVYLWFVWDPVQPSVYFSFEVLFFSSAISLILPGLALKSLIIFLAGILYINVEFLLFLLHFILVS